MAAGSVLLSSEWCGNCGVNEANHLDDVRGITKPVCGDCCSCPRCSDGEEESTSAESARELAVGLVAPLFGR